MFFNTLFRFLPARSNYLVISRCKHVQAARYKRSIKGNKPLTYEMAGPPHTIAHIKGWNSWNTCMINNKIKIFRFKHFYLDLFSVCLKCVIQFFFYRQHVGWFKTG